MNNLNIFCFGFGQVAKCFIKKLKLENFNINLSTTSREKLKNFYKDSKKVSNKKMKDFFNYTLKFPTYIEGLNYNFVKNIENAEIGDWVITYNDDIVVGAREWIGEYTDVPAMGFDDNTITSGYCDNGDKISFRLYKNETGELLEMYYEANIPKWADNTIQMLGSFNTINIPEEISLLPSYPYPYNPSTNVQFTIPNDMDVALTVYDINGRLIDEIVNSNLSRGYYNFNWNANEFSSGVYFIQLIAGEKQEIQKVILMK